jgi:hypothetical protein
VTERWCSSVYGGRERRRSDPNLAPLRLVRADTDVRGKEEEALEEERLWLQQLEVMGLVASLMLL